MLDDLLADAKDLAAPPQLQAQAAAVRRYLHLPDNSTVSSDQYRRFTSRFEQYLLENTAPDRALAEVFADFRKWLITLCEIADCYGERTSDDIRDWYARILLLHCDMAAVIAPDQMIRPEPQARVPRQLKKDPPASIRMRWESLAIWFIALYFFLAISIAFSAAHNVGWSAGAYAFVSSVLFISAGGGLKASLWWGDKVQKVGGLAIAVVLVVIARWLSTGFSVRILDFSMSGALWGWIGFGITFICADRKLTLGP